MNKTASHRDPVIFISWTALVPWIFVFEKAVFLYLLIEQHSKDGACDPGVGVGVGLGLGVELGVGLGDGLCLQVLEVNYNESVLANVWNKYF